MKQKNIIVRQAILADLPAIADAHRPSINEIGPDFYAPEIVKIWGRKRDVQRYKSALENDGETYFIAEYPDRPNYALGFSSYRFQNGQHDVAAVYVRGSEAQQGVGLQLITAVEKMAIENGATEIFIEASLSAEHFYKRCGYIEQERIMRPMSDGQTIVDMETIHMVKTIDLKKAD